MNTKRLFLLLVAVVFTFALHAQLKVTSDGKVKIASTSNTSYSSLLVGNTQYGGHLCNVGITASRPAVDGKNNIGVLGTTSASYNSSGGTYYGVLGIVDQVNINHGRNYGLCGMIGFNEPHYGGAGIYATNYTYFFFLSKKHTR